MKRLSKQEREEKGIAALEKRMVDIYATAREELWDESAILSAYDAMRIIRTVLNLWQIHTDNDKYQVITGYWNLDEWESPRKAAEFLHRWGFRA